MDLSAARPYSEFSRAERLKLKLDIARAACEALPATGMPKSDLLTTVAQRTHYFGPALEFGIQYGVEQRMLRRGEGDWLFCGAAED
jgi:hypothetical protein